MTKAKVITKETEAKKSKFALLDKNGDIVHVSRKDFMVVYKKMITDSAKKVKL